MLPLWWRTFGENAASVSFCQLGEGIDFVGWCTWGNHRLPRRRTVGNLDMRLDAFARVAVRRVRDGNAQRIALGTARSEVLRRSAAGLARVLRRAPVSRRELRGVGAGVAAAPMAGRAIRAVELAGRSALAAAPDRVCAAFRRAILGAHPPRRAALSGLLPSRPLRRAPRPAAPGG